MRDDRDAILFNEGLEFERRQIIAALRSKDAADEAERSITALFAADAETNDRIAAQAALAAIANWLRERGRKMTADTDRPWYALATYFDPKPYRRRPKN